MTPLAAILLAQFTLLGAAWAIVVKWWTIWFVLGQHFRRTSRFCLGVLLWQAAIAAALLKSGALYSGEQRAYPSDGFSAEAWAAALAVTVAAGAALETWWLRAEMRRTVRAGWAWRRYDRLGYAFSHGVSVVGSLALVRWI